MIDWRQPDDVSALARAVTDRNPKLSGYPQSYWVAAKKFLDSRYATIANRRAEDGRSMIVEFEEIAVADIVVQCPRTGTPVPTGLKSEWVFLRSLPRVAIPLRCPACGQTHKWQPQEAWIATPVQAGAAPAVSGARTAGAEA
jgi:endogenous inhibitor of DNA gyrase (YacG/DUF329 family)